MDYNFLTITCIITIQLKKRNLLIKIKTRSSWLDKLQNNWKSDINILVF